MDAEKVTKALAFTAASLSGDAEGQRALLGGESVPPWAAGLVAEMVDIIASLAAGTDDFALADGDDARTKVINVLRAWCAGVSERA